MSDDLRRCPFCGGEAKIRSYRTFIDDFHGIGTKFYVECGECSARRHLGERTEEEAIAAWNARAERTCHIRYHGGAVSEGGMEAEDWFYCDACGEEIPGWAQDAWAEYSDNDFEGTMPFRHCPNCGAKVVAE